MITDRNAIVTLEF